MLSKNKMVTAAQRAARKAIESTYSGICTIIEQRDVLDEKTKITRKSEVTTTINQPCRLSFERLNASVATDTAAEVSQSIKLFLAPEIKVKSGSKIIVEHYGTMTEYASSGEPAVYASHQEIMLELFREWS